jgi:outer membrane receptor protein involved in Fe transport
MLILGASPGHSQTPPVLTNDIPPQPLPEALAAFARQTGLQLVYESTVARGHTSKAVPAGLERSAALTQLLDGTGLQFEFLNERSVHILAAKPKMPPTHASPSPRREYASDGPPSGLEEVIVTATAREEIVSKVPISIGVWTQEEMAASHITDLTELAALTPGVVYSAGVLNGAGFASSIVMRGIADTGIEATTGIYLDDTPIHHRTYATAYYGDILPVTFDLERVEVLRGPQGTLGGDAAFGGAIHFITNKPSLTEWSGLARSEVATTDRGGMSYEVGAAVGGPIVPEAIGFRVSVWSRWDGGYVDRVDPITGATVDSNANRSRAQSIRAALLFEPAEGVRISPAFAYQSKYLHDTPFFNAVESDRGGAVFQNNANLLQQPYEDAFYIASVTITAKLTGADLTAITAYSHRDAFAVQENTNYPPPPTSYLDAVALNIPLGQNSLSQEIRFASSDTQARVSWLAGMWLSRSTEVEGFANIPVDPSLGGNPGYSQFTGSATQIDGFGQVDLKFTNDLTTTLGVRVGHTRSATTFAQGPTSSLGPPYGGDDSETVVAPRFVLSHASDQYGILYLTISKGYQLGGPNTPPTCGSGTYAPATLWNYELGTKAPLFDGHMQLEASVFHLDWRNMQQLLNLCGPTYIVNAGRAASNGFDLSVHAAVTERVRLAAALEYADARYTTTVFFPDGSAFHAGDVVGGTGVPPWSGSVSAEVDVFRTPLLTVNVRAEDIVRSHNTGPFSTGAPGTGYVSPSLLKGDPATNLLNTRLSFHWAGYEVAAYVNNVFNSLPILGFTPLVYGYPLTFADTFRPRTIGVSGSVRF